MLCMARTYEGHIFSDATELAIADVVYKKVTSVLFGFLIGKANYPRQIDTRFRDLSCVEHNWSRKSRKFFLANFTSASLQSAITHMHQGRAWMHLESYWKVRYVRKKQRGPDTPDLTLLSSVVAKLDAEIPQPR